MSAPTCDLIESNRNSSKFVICSKIAPNMTELRLQIAMVFNSTIIEMYDDMFWIS